MRTGIVGSMILWGLLAFYATGCVKSVDLWGAKLEFGEGLDLHTGYNAITNVNDQRGLTPTRGTREGSRVENVKY